MKIGIDIRSTLKKNRTGIGRYTINLVNALARTDSQNEYLLYSRKKLLDFKRRLPRLTGRNFSHRVDYFGRGLYAVMGELDIFHTSSYDLERPGRAKLIVSVHDVIHRAYPAGHDKKTIKEIDDKFVRMLKGADLLIASSYNTKKDILKFYDFSEDRVIVIYPGVELVMGNVLVETKPRLGREPYILFIGTLEPRKNVDGLIKAFSWIKRDYNLPHKLYIVGMKGWMYQSIFKAYEESMFKNDIIFKGSLPTEALDKLYREAEVFVYPSFYEGFGFPIVEAFSCGTPVVTSKTSSCGEIAGEAALLIGPGDYKDIGRAILRLINEEELREDIVRKGFQRAREFEWDNTAREVMKLFSQ